MNQTQLSSSESEREPAAGDVNAFAVHNQTKQHPQ